MAVATAKPGLDMVYLTGKLVCEAGEASQMALKHAYHGRPMDYDQLAEELGDVLWYAANAARLMGLSLESVAILNVQKLNERHGLSYNAAYYDVDSRAMEE
jgi:NTP pyrophosphatase (non-canonical NTP hydrolase)